LQLSSSKPGHYVIICQTNHGAFLGIGNHGAIPDGDKFVNHSANKSKLIIRKSQGVLLPESLDITVQ